MSDAAKINVGIRTQAPVIRAGVQPGGGEPVPIPFDGNMHGGRITHLAEGVADTDAANVKQVTEAIQAAILDSWAEVYG